MTESINEKSVVIIETVQILKKSDREREEIDLGKKLGCKVCILDGGKRIESILSGE